jgi:bla regulator protein blaR1
VEMLYRAGLSNAVSATVLALFVACLGRVLGRRPAVLHCLWLLVLLKLVTPPLYQVSIPWPERWGLAQQTTSTAEVVLLDLEQELAYPVDSDDVVHGPSAGSVVSHGRHQAQEATLNVDKAPSIDWMRLACVIWIGGTITCVFTSIGRIRRFRVLLSGARPVDDAAQEWVDDLAGSLGLDRPPSVWWIDGKLSPMVWPVGWRPRLILPAELWKGLDEQQRATLIIHELAHLRRGDHLLRFFELLVTALYWWHPVLWWARRALRDVEEQCCDAWVVWALPEAAKSYAETLLETLDFLHYSDLSEPLLASGFGKVHHLRKRLTMIMTGTTPRLLGVWGTLGSLGLAVVLLPVNATWAQKSEEREQVRIIVKTEGDTTASASSIATAVNAAPDGVTAVVTAAEDAVPGEVNVIVKSNDDDAVVVAARSVDEAVAKLKDQIQALSKKSPQSEKDKSRQKALERALKQLETAAARVKDLHASGDKVKPGKDVRAVVIRRREEDKEISAEKKAEIEKARAKVQELTKALQSMQKELREAHVQLSKLMSTNTKPSYVTVRPVKPQIDVPPPLPRLPELTTTAKVPRGTLESSLTMKPGANSNQKRIDELEKKLEKLLEEVATLKKDRAK